MENSLNSGVCQLRNIVLHQFLLQVCVTRRDHLLFLSCLGNVHVA
jgi:hypothetical protein